MRTGAGVVALSLAWLALVGCAAPPMPPRVAPMASTRSVEGPIVVLSDTQRTSWAERLLGREQNEEPRRALIQKVAVEEHPALVVHLGDMVVAGGTPENWEYFDRLMSPLTARRIPILPVLGNHDYWGDDRAALREARERFPQLTATGWYALQRRGLGLVWLNSNLEGAAAREQASWFARILATFDRDRHTRAVLAFTHHPPYTNGKQRYGDEYVLAELLPSFRRAQKAVAMLSGHVHGYERFQVDGKMFVVTGGGGGPRVTYHMGRDAEPAPAYVPPDGRRRAFNYVVVNPVVVNDSLERLDFTVKCLLLDAVCEGGVLEAFSLPVPAPAAG